MFLKTGFDFFNLKLTRDIKIKENQIKLQFKIRYLTEVTNLLNASI